jgi:saccharopine dehydrogenase-like NADP-dependent oxidoreductase
MKTILVLGAGRSSSSLIGYLLSHAQQNNWRIIVGDVSLEAAKEKINLSSSGSAIRFDINETENSISAISLADVVISLLPAHLHPLVAVRCLELKKHLLTASYVSDEMKAFHEPALKENLIFVNECGLDPGIDHMSAMQVLDRIHAQGGKLIAFESFTGGLIAPETDPGNPWRYKFTWNSRNVVMAGQSTAKFLQGGFYKYIPYQQLFKRVTAVHVPGLGDFEGYANRDSLKYIDTYNLHGIKTMQRGTLRNKGFCSAWDVFVQLGCCDDTYEMEDVNEMTHASFINSFLNSSKDQSIAEKIKSQLSLDKNDSRVSYLQWAGMFDEELIGLSKGTPAQILEHILNKKWKLQTHDKDQIVMWHRFKYSLNGKQKEIQASLIATGTDSVYTAMAKTVGLPLAITARLILEGKIKSRGVVIPTSKEIYEPVLEALKDLGIELKEMEIH